MITLKSKSWGHSIGKRLYELKQKEILCDVVITGCDEESKCKLANDSECNNFKNNADNSQNKFNSSQCLDNLSSDLTSCSVSPYTNTMLLNDNTSENKIICKYTENEQDHVDESESINLQMTGKSAYQHKVHSSILAASSKVLQNALTSCPKKDYVKVLHFHGISNTLWEDLLQFIYLGTISVTQKTMLKLENVAKEMHLQELSSLILSINKLSGESFHCQDYITNKTNDNATHQSSVDADNPDVKLSQKGDLDISQVQSLPPTTKSKPSNKNTKLSKYNENQKIQKLICQKKHRRKRLPRKLLVTGDYEEDPCEEAEVEIDMPQPPRLETIHELELPVLNDCSTKIKKQRDVLTCRNCSKVMTAEESLSDHVCVKQEKGGSYPCSECPKQFSRKQDLKLHSRIHSGEKPYKCTDCSKEFTQKTNMLLHKKTHDNIKNFKCNICNKTFLRKWGLQEHKKTHSGEKPYLCQTCGKSFSKISNLQVHERIHSGIKPYKCSHCSQSFSDPSTFKQHLVIHSSERAFQCVECGKQFARFKALKEHERVHTGEKPHVCEICNAKFANTSNFSRHKKFHMKKDKKLQENKVKVESIDTVTSQTLEVSNERSTANYNNLIKATPLSDLAGFKMNVSQNPPDFLDMSIGSYKSENFINVIGNNHIPLQQNGNIINQSASISGIIPHELNLQQITSNNNNDRSIVIVPSDARFIEHLGVVDGVNLEPINTLSGGESHQLYPYQITYPASYNNSGLVQTNLTLQLPNNLQQ